MKRIETLLETFKVNNNSFNQLSIYNLS